MKKNTSERESRVAQRPKVKLAEFFGLTQSPDAIRANRAAAIEQENYDEGRISRRRARINPHGD